MSPAEKDRAIIAATLPGNTSLTHFTDFRSSHEDLARLLSAVRQEAYKEGWNDREDDLIAGVNRIMPEEPSQEGAGEPVAGYCKPCGTMRAAGPCHKCGAELKPPHPDWEEPPVPDVAPIRALAREVGYAIGEHGSKERDLDLIAAPWTADAVSPQALADHIAGGINGRVLAPEQKPAGRWSCNIQIDGWFKIIDLSVLPPNAQALEAGEPVAWRVKDFADGWFFYGKERGAEAMRAQVDGFLVQPLYTSPPTDPRIKALEEALETARDALQAAYQRTGHADDLAAAHIADATLLRTLETSNV